VTKSIMITENFSTYQSNHSLKSKEIGIL